MNSNFIEVERFWALIYRFPAQYHPILMCFEFCIVVIFTSLGKPFFRYEVSGVLLSIESNSYLEHRVNISCQSVNLSRAVPAMT